MVEKSYREIKSSLDMSRKRQAISRTAQIEAKIVEEIQSKCPNIRNNIFVKDMVFRERVRKQRQKQSLELSRSRLVLNKARHIRLQEERLNPFLNSEKRPQNKDNVPEKALNPVDQLSKLRRMEYKY